MSLIVYEGGDVEKAISIFYQPELGKINIFAELNLEKRKLENSDLRKKTELEFV